MKGYRKAIGAYIELSDGTPVGDTLVPVAIRPSVNHVFADTWQTAPLDPAVCWRAKTNAELDADVGDKFDGMDKTARAVLLLMRSYCNALLAGTYTNKTITQLKADFVTAYKALP